MVMKKDALVVLLNDAIEVYLSEVGKLSDIRKRQIQSLQELGKVIKTDVMLVCRIKRLIEEVEKPSIFSQAFFIALIRPSRFVRALKSAIKAYENALKAFRDVTDQRHRPTIQAIEVIPMKKVMPSPLELQKQSERLALGC